MSVYRRSIPPKCPWARQRALLARDQLTRRFVDRFMRSLRELRLQCGHGRVASLSCCNFAVAQVPGGGQFMRRSPPREWLGQRLASDALKALAFELGELDAVGGVADVEVENGPDEGEAAGLAGGSGRSPWSFV